ncbi:hypothetical protein ABZP36_028931 [Zizania latifolia]
MSIKPSSGRHQGPPSNHNKQGPPSNRTYWGCTVHTAAVLNAIVQVHRSGLLYSSWIRCQQSKRKTERCTAQAAAQTPDRLYIWINITAPALLLIRHTTYVSEVGCQQSYFESDF